MRCLSLTVCLVTGLALTPAHAGGRITWDYGDHLGPETWADLDPSWEACREGAQQSPVDLVNPIETEIADLELHWRGADWQVLNTGHTIEVEAEDPGYALIDNQRYNLVGFNFHTPSEHAINGLHYPMELQFVHRNDAGEVAVIAVMLKGGGRNDTLEAIFAKAPVHANDRNHLGPLDISPLVSDIGDILQYQGSLTTPPCTENVLWTVLTDPVTVSDAAILAFSSVFPMNARPLQPLNRRYVLSD